MKPSYRICILLCLLLPAFLFGQSMFLRNQAEVNAFPPGLTHLAGNLTIGYYPMSDITDLTPLQNLRTISSDLTIHYTPLTTLHGLEQLQSVVYVLSINNNPNLMSLAALNGLNSCNTIVIARNGVLASVDAFNQITQLEGLWITEMPQLTTISGLRNLQEAYEIEIRQNPLLTSITGLTRLDKISYLTVISNDLLTNCCTLYPLVVAAKFAWVESNGPGCTSAEILAGGPCSNEMTVALRFMDRAGMPVGDVIGRLSIPQQQDAKIVSLYEWQSLWNLHPYNALCRSGIPYAGASAQMTFEAPAGWRFTGPDYLNLEVPGGSNFYSLEGNDFILERSDGSEAPPAPAQLVCPPENEAPFALAFLKGSPSWPSEPWCNAVDGDIEDWEGTATVLDDSSKGYPWALFRFAADGTYLVKSIGVQTGNFQPDENPARRATVVEILLSNTGMEAADFSSAGVFKLKEPLMSWFNLAQPAEARYVMLKILQPQYAPHGYKQIVEFCINEGPEPPYQVPSQPISESAPLLPVPQGTALLGAYPNPFNPVTTISYQLAESGAVHVTICNLAGQTVATLVDATQPAGLHNVQWHAADLPSGVYLCRLQAGVYQKNQRILLVK